MNGPFPDHSQPSGKAGNLGVLARLRSPERSGERLRWGVTGLATIFLIVMLAAARLGPTPNPNQATGSTGAGVGEPLAVLGVAPGPAARPPEPPEQQ